MKEISYDRLGTDIITNFEMNYNTKYFKFNRSIIKIVSGMSVIMFILELFLSGSLLVTINGLSGVIMLIILRKIICKYQGIRSFANVSTSIKLFKIIIDYDDKDIIFYKKIFNFKIRGNIKVKNIKEYNNLYIMRIYKRKIGKIEYKNILSVPKTAFKNKDDENDFKKYFYLNMKDYFEKVDGDFDCTLDMSNIKKEKTYALICVFCMITYFFIITII